ncbi:MAG: beta-(1-3)-glucosyl transferase, partial [Gammaproteobacteria bacterium]|nr:beta-(1-3)-glucosyl transferase [Gammaproteobacteria bacterium]
NLAALGWSLAMVWAPKTIDPPMLLFSLLPVALFMFKTAKLIYIYKSRIGASTLQTLLGGLAGLSLAHTISRAVLQGIFTKGMPFIRTPKHAGQTGLRSVIVSVREETLFLIALWSAVYAIVLIQGADSADTLFWIAVLLIQSITYLAALVVATVAAAPGLSARLIGIREIERPEVLLSNTENT